MLTTYGIHQPPLTERKLLVRLGYAGVYFLSWDCDDPQNDPVKVGIATDPFSRFASIQCGNWRRLVVHEILWVKSRPHASDFRKIVNTDGQVVGTTYDKFGDGYMSVSAIEASAHKLLIESGSHVCGEWFSGGSDKLVETVKTHITGVFKHDYLSHRSMLRMLKAWKTEAEAA